MEVLKTIRDRDVGETIPDPALYKERAASRAVVFDTEQNVGLIYSTKNKYHKLPGGGIEEGEDTETALAREVLEEIGCTIEHVTELGMIEEYRNKHALHQISYCYVAQVVGEKGTASLDEGELAEGFETVWMPLGEAISALEREARNPLYEAKFMTLRELTFLTQARSYTERVC